MIKTRNIGKYYRIGVKLKNDDNMAGAALRFLKSPWENYKKYRSLYRFDEHTILEKSGDSEFSDIVWALRGVSFDIERGQAVGIIGRNGAGKSTLLKIFSRITPPNVGWCEITGRVSSLLEVGTGFHPELTGRENVYLNGTILGMRKREVEQKFDQIVDFSGVEQYIDTPVKRYSSGMAVRLAFSVAAHLDPDILIIDEVLAVGDAAFQKKCLNKMEEVGQQGRTVIFVSHNMSAVTRLCKRAILLESGSITRDGPAREVVSAYLKSSQETLASRKWEEDEAPCSDIVKLDGIKIITEDGEIANTFDVTEPIFVEMEYTVKREEVCLLPHFILNNQDGIRLFIGLDTDVDWKGKRRPKGRYISRAKIPGNLLSEGTLYVGPCMRTLEPDIYHFGVVNAVSFDVIDSGKKNSARGEWATEIGGLIRPLLEWETEFQAQ